MVILTNLLDIGLAFLLVLLLHVRACLRSIVRAFLIEEQKIVKKVIKAQNKQKKTTK